MFDRPRVIPCLLIDNQKLVKTVQFKHPNYLGDPINAVKIFNEKQADELCIIDITRKKNDINYDLLHNIATEAFMPLSYGGGIQNIDQIKRLFSIGFEKIIMNTSLFFKPELIREAVKFAGSQSVVASIDYRKTIFNKLICFTQCGAKNTKISPIDMAMKVTEMGVGEVLINCIDRDGMMSGYDLDTVKVISSKVDIPVIACGGAGGLEDVKKVIDNGADAVAAGSIFVYYGAKKAVLINYPTEDEMIKAGIFR